MKRQGNWREKLDAHALGCLEGYRKASAIRNKFSEPGEWHSKLQEIAAQHPQIRVLGKVEILPQFLEVLLKSEATAELVASYEPTSGSKTMSEPVAKFVDVMQTVTLALEDPEMRIAAGVVAGFAALVLGGMYEVISTSNFGDAGPQTTEDWMWTFGTVLEVLGHTMKTGNPPDLKGRVNVELIGLIKLVREHQTAKLTYRELQEALQYAGMHVPDEETLRVFEWRARKKGWIKSESKPPVVHREDPC
jgi:hypothetical protein